MLYALGGIGGGLTLYMDKGQLVYEYNMMMIERYIGRSAAQIGTGKHRIVIDTSIGKPGGPADVAITVDDQEAMRVAVKRTVAGAFSASETLDVGSGPRLAGVVRLFRPPTICIHRSNRGRHSRSALKAPVARCECPRSGLSRAADPKSRHPRP